jgi:hypothetical protein
MSELELVPVAGRTVLAHGADAFADTRRRAGLNDGTASDFSRYFGRKVDRPGVAYLGAWKDGRLAAFLSIVHVDDWAELNCFSTTSMLKYRPNDALMYAALSYYVGGRACRVVSYGVSSIQARSNAAGLHRFKRKVGFVPVRVHRGFEFHPAVRPLANRLTLTAAHWTANGALRLRPQASRLRKLGGMLACMLGATSMMQAAEANQLEASEAGPRLCVT